MSLIKKIVAIATVFSVLSFVSPAFGATVEELQAQINQLLAQVTQLQAQLAALQGQPTVTGCTITSFDRNLKQGMSGDDVKCLQIILNSATDTQVATEGAGSPGNETTYFGPLTFAAVVKFQEKYAPDILATYGLTTGTGFVGTTTRAKLNTLIGVTPPTGCTTDADCAAGYMCSAGTCVVVAPVTGPLTVSLSADNPVGANVQKGSANNGILRVVFTGGSTATTITGLTFTSYGTTEATGSTDISAARLYDENGVQLGTDKTPTGNKLFFVIVPALVVSANGTRTITLTASVGTNAVSVEVIRYGIAASTDITSSSAFTGSFPITGNSFQIVPAGQLGTVTVAKLGTPPATSVKIGQTGVILERFTVSAGSNEGVIVKQVVVTNGASATIADSDVSNLRIRKTDGTIVAGPLTFTNLKATFSLTSPITLAAGQSVNLEVIGDIANGNSRVIQAQIASGGVVAQGVNSGVNIVSSGSTSGTTITIGIGTLTVSMSSAHPQGSASYLIKTTNTKALAVFSIRATGENIIVNNVDLNFDITDVGGTKDTLNTTDTWLSSVGIYQGDSLVSNLQDIQQETDVTFALNLTIPANTTVDLTVKGVTNTLAFTTDATLVTTWSKYVAYGLSSGSQIGLTGNAYLGNVGTTAITIYPSGIVTTSNDSTYTPYDQGILAPINNVVIGAFKVYAQREDQKLTDLVITVSGDSNYVSANTPISSITLYDTSGTQLSNPITPVTGGTNIDTFTFSSSAGDFLSDIIFTKNTYKTLVVKANINSTADGAAGVYAYIAAASNQLKTSGQDSGTTYDFTSGQSMAFSSPYYGGTFAFDSILAVVKKNATSPSGTANGRGTLVPYAIFDVVNASADPSNNVVITDVVFTSKTGLPSGLTDATDNALFVLTDGEGNVLCQNGVSSCTVTLTKASGTVEFAKAAMLTVQAGAPKQLVLEITTTSLTIWPSTTQMQWMIYGGYTAKPSKDLTVTSGLVGIGPDAYGVTTSSIPAVANIVTMP